MTVSGDKPFLAASADLETECDCSGKGLCEIKCPESIKDQEPYIDNVTYLKENDGTIILDHKHAYFFQIQGQMKILKREFCDFYIYTHHGSLCVRVSFDPEFWETLQEKLTWFWLEFVMPKLLNDHDQPSRENKELDQSVNCDGCAVWFCEKCRNNFKFSVQDKI